MTALVEQPREGWSKTVVFIVDQVGDSDEVPRIQHLIDEDQILFDCGAINVHGYRLVAPRASALAYAKTRTTNLVVKVEVEGVSDGLGKKGLLGWQQEADLAAYRIGGTITMLSQLMTGSELSPI